MKPTLNAFRTRCSQHKEAAFHSMCHRVCRLPLNDENFRKDYIYQRSGQKKNGYTRIFVEGIMKKHSNKVTTSNLSTHFTQSQTNQKKKNCVHFHSRSNEQIITEFERL